MGGNDADMDEVIPSLYVGNEEAALDVDLLKEKGITYVLNVSDRPTVPGSPSSATASGTGSTPAPPPGVNCLQVSFCDFGGSDITALLQECFDFLDKATDSNSKALVHCQMGANRSPTVVVAYLMKRHNMDLKTSSTKVKKCRAAAWPVENYIRQLIQFELTLRGSNSVTYEELVGIFHNSVNRFKSDLFKNFKQPDYALQD